MSEQNNQLSDIDKQIEALMEQKRKLQEDEAKKARMLTININKFNPITSKVEFTLSKYREDIINYLRFYMERSWYKTPEGVDKNIVSTFNLDYHLEEIKKRGDVEILWNKADLEKYNEYKSLPDISVDVNEKKSFVTLKLGPKIRPNSFYLSREITTLTITTNGMTFSLAEFHMFPEVMAKLYPSYQVTYSDKAKKVLVELLNKQKLFAELANAKDAPDISNPFTGIDPSTNLPYDLAPHQRVAVKFIELSGGNGIVAYDMGTGKSAIGIALAERAEYKKVLVICPASLKTNWKREIKKFTGQDANVFQGVEPDELSIDTWVSDKYRYHIINYDIIGRGYKKGAKEEDQGIMAWVILFSTVKPDFIICDEGHYIKNMDSGRSKGVLTLAANVQPKEK